MPRKIYPNSFKIEVVKYYKQGHTTAETLQRYCIAESTLFKWKGEYESRNFLRVNKQSDVAVRSHLKTHLKKLEQVAEVLEKCPCGVTATVDEKMKAIKELEGQYSIRVLCQALRLPRGTYYNRKKREGEQTQYEKSDNEFRPLIKKIFYESGERFGNKPVRQKLLEMGYHIQESRVSRLMKEMGLQVKAPIYMKEHLKPIPNSKFKYRNLIKQNFNPDAPNLSWVSDITYTKVNDHYMFVCVIIDLYSRKIISYGISDVIDTVLVLNTFDSAYESRQKPMGLIFHSDQGVQYTAYAFRQRLKEANVKQSFSSPGNPYDNSVCESFFRNMKKEAIYHHLYNTPEELSSVVDEYIDFYNNKRPHRTLKLKTPSQYETEFYSAV